MAALSQQEFARFRAMDRAERAKAYPLVELLWFSLMTSRGTTAYLPKRPLERDCPYRRLAALYGARTSLSHSPLQVEDAEEAQRNADAIERLLIPFGGDRASYFIDGEGI